MRNQVAFLGEDGLTHGGLFTVGPYRVLRGLVRAPQAWIVEAEADDAGRALVQLVHIRAVRSRAEELERKSFESALAQQTVDLFEEPDFVVHAHGHVQRQDGSRILFWALPWNEAALNLMTPGSTIQNVGHLIDVAIALSARLHRRHERGRLEPLMSEQLVAVSDEEIALLGVPIFIPPGWLAPEMPSAKLAPEEIKSLSPSKLGDIWRLGHTLTALASCFDTIPGAFSNLLKWMTDDDPKKRPARALEVRVECESVKERLTASSAQPVARSPSIAPLSFEEVSQLVVASMGPTGEPLDPKDREMAILQGEDEVTLAGSVNVKELDQPPAPTGVPPWAFFFSSAEYDRFLGLVKTELDVRHLRYKIGTGVVQLIAEDGSDLEYLGLSQVARACYQQPEEDWRKLIAADLEKQIGDAAETVDSGRSPAHAVEEETQRINEHHLREMSVKETVASSQETDRPPDPPPPTAKAPEPEPGSDVVEVSEKVKVDADSGIDLKEAGIVLDHLATLADKSISEIADSQSPTIPPRAPVVPASEVPTVPPQAPAPAPTPPDDSLETIADRPALSGPHPTSPYAGTLPSGNPEENRVPEELRAEEAPLQGTVPAPHDPGRVPPDLQKKAQENLERKEASRPEVIPPYPDIPSNPVPPGGTLPSPGPIAPTPMAPAVVTPNHDVQAIGFPRRDVPLIQKGHTLPARPVVYEPPHPKPQQPAPLIEGAGTLDPSMAAAAQTGGARNALVAFLLVMTVVAVVGAIVLAEQPTESTAALTTITTDGEIILRADPANAIVVGKDDGRILGRAPLRFLLPRGEEASVIVTAPGRKPQRIILRGAGQVSATLDPLTARDAECEVPFEGVKSDDLSKVVGNLEIGANRLKLRGASVVRTRPGSKESGAWIVKCPPVGLSDTVTLSPKRLEAAELHITEPVDTEAIVEGKSLGAIPVSVTVPRAFTKVAIDEGSGPKGPLWIPVSRGTELRVDSVPADLVRRVEKAATPPPPPKKSTKKRRRRRRRRR